MTARNRLAFLKPLKLKTMRNFLTALVLILFFSIPALLMLNHGVTESNKIKDNIENMKKQDSTILNVTYHNGVYYTQYK